jgi:hypothetical protein
MTFNEMDKALDDAAERIATLMEKVPDEPYLGMDRHDTVEHHVTLVLRQLWEVVDGLKQAVEKQQTFQESVREALQSS